MFEIFEKTALECSRMTTNKYSTSFSMGVRLLSADIRWAIYGIYGFVRFADEIVDTFDRKDKAILLDEFKQDTYTAINRGISLNPILHSFQKVANQYGIDKTLIDPFFNSMEADLHQKYYNEQEYKDYIYGSAEVVGLMCLRVFCNGDDKLYNELLEPARALGSAFQKVNFLRDIKNDDYDLGRIYFPGIYSSHLNENDKEAIIQDIKNDFEHALIGIMKLPEGSKTGVYTSYIYYKKLLDRIERKNASELLSQRIRVPDSEKFALLVKSFLKFRLHAR